MTNIALIQMKVTANSEDNLNKGKDLVKKAAAAGAQIVVLPEMFICPYETPLFPQFAEPEGGPVWQALSDLAKSQQIWLFAGSVPERGEEGDTPDQGREGHVYNTCYVFNPEGTCVGKHRKVHLFDIDIQGGQRFKESDTLSPGTEPCLIETPFGKIGVMICFDIRFAEWARLLTDMGAQMLIIPGAFNMTTGPKHWELLIRARALDNQLFVAAVSPARDESASYVAYGNSMIADPWGDVIHRLDEKEGVLMTEIDLAMGQRVRGQLPVLSARRLDLYSRCHSDKNQIGDQK